MAVDDDGDELVAVYGGDDADHATDASVEDGDSLGDAAFVAVAVVETVA